MTMQFLLTVIDDGTGPATATEDAAIDVFNDKLRTDGNWVFAGGLGDTDDATTIDNRVDTTGASGKAIITDGPFVESKEFLAGFWIVDAADLDAALALGAEGSRACNRKIEVRPFLEP
jgi:hypothetical protein